MMMTFFHALSYIQPLLEVGQNLCENIHHSNINDLQNDIEKITHAKARIIFHDQHTKIQLPSHVHSSIPIQFNQFVYGMLCISTKPGCPDEPALPLSLATTLAQLCGWLIHSCEHTAILQGRYKRLEQPIYGSLTKREYEVLTLMCRGYSQDQIADILNITNVTVTKHKQKIYALLGVHNEYDAVIAAYSSGLFSLVSTEDRHLVAKEKD
jgi:DNA-binding CsgD family transcriptional regulator